MASRFTAVTNKEISQTIKQGVPKIHEEDDEIRFGSRMRETNALKSSICRQENATVNRLLRDEIITVGGRK